MAGIPLVHSWLSVAGRLAVQANRRIALPAECGRPLEAIVFRPSVLNSCATRQFLRHSTPDCFLLPASVRFVEILSNRTGFAFPRATGLSVAGVPWALPDAHRAMPALHSES